ncbi:phosphatidylglycerophosphatase A family protein [Planctomicrobium sp. SH661]|uniref:phosphatidylglycerophosphatase A family protein n=1 Tax=Planctomicrobium sp. SH661 TaxID=3448124 RepID=UPI003F5B8DCC
MSEPAATSTAPASLGDRALNILATGFGTGYFPRGPGTVGSLLGPPLIWLLGTDGTRPLITVLCGIVFFLIGIPICNAGIRVLHAKDPQQVVFDEIVAFFWVFLLVPINIGTAVSGFLLFRVFDILKPWPIRRLEWLPRGLGIMADDAVAGMIAGGLLAIGWRLFGATGL